MKKRGISLLLAMVMLFSVLPVQAVETEITVTESAVVTETEEPVECSHEYVEAVTTAPTCTEAGESTYTCGLCGDTHTEEIAALDHSWAEADCDTPATCAVCGETAGEALGHSWTEGICDVCGAEAVVPAAPAVTAATAEASGKIALCWEAVDGAVSYAVYRADAGEYTLLTTTEDIRIEDASAVAGETYSYYVVAVSGDGMRSEQSNTVSGFCILAQPVVTAFNVASTGEICLDWETVDGAVNYRIYRAAEADGEYEHTYTTVYTKYTNTAAEPGETYYYKVVAVAAEESANSVCSEIVSETCSLPRPVVTASNAEASGKPMLTWEAVDGAVKYRVYRAAEKDGDYKNVFTTTGTKYTNTAAEPGVKYYYKVKAVAENTEANSANSALKSRTCDLAQPVVTVSNVEASGKNKLTWEAVDGAVKYRVYRSAEKDGEYKNVYTTENTSYINTSAKAGEKYYYKVRAISENTDAHSVYSAVRGRTCNLARPEAVVTASSTKSITIAWEAVEDAVSYRVYRTAGGTYKLLKTLTETELTDTTVSAGTIYTYKVRAVAENSDANSAYCEPVQAKAAPIAPVMESTAKATGSSVTISWSESDDATGYYVYSRASTEDSWSKLATISSAGTTSYTHSDCDGSRYYCVSAYVVSGGNVYISIKSDAIRARTLDAVPSLNIAEDGDINRLSWSAVTGATGYEIYQSVDGESGWTLAAELGKETDYADNLGNYYKIRPIYRSGGKVTYGPLTRSYVIVMIDPGHGGSDPGAVKTHDGVTYHEADLNWKISNYCRDALESNYKNVKVYMTRGKDENPALQSRVDFAESVDSDFLLSIHLNSSGKGTVSGAMALVPRGAYRPAQAAASQEVGTAILEELEALGIPNKGFLYNTNTSATYPNGVTADAYYIVRYGVLANLPAIIMEQCFLDCASDYKAFLSTEAKLQALGEANARGLAEVLDIT